jgi:hypothetical protein
MIDAQAVGCGDRVEAFVRASLDVVDEIHFAKVRGFFSTAHFFRFRAGGEAYYLKIYDEHEGFRFVESEWRAGERVAEEFSLRTHAVDHVLRASIIAAGTVIPVPPGRAWFTLLPRIGQTVARLHERHGGTNEPGVYELLQTLMERRERAYEGLPIFRDVWSALLEVAPVLYSLESEGKVLCHNALHAGNITVGQSDVRFGNWEYATATVPLFDLAAAIELMQLNAAQAGTLLEGYYGGKPPTGALVHLPVLRIAACALHALLLLPEHPMIGHMPHLQAGQPVLDLSTCLELLAADALDPVLSIDRWRLGLAFLDRARTITATG